MHVLLSLCLSVWLWLCPALMLSPPFSHDISPLAAARQSIIRPAAIKSAAIGEINTAQASSALASPTEILSRLFTEATLESAWFADSFLAQISLGEISQITQGILSSVGAYQSIEDVPNGFVLTFSRGTVATHLALNSQGQITGLLFETPQLIGLSLAAVINEIEALPGKTHLFATHNHEEIAALNADAPLAVGSTFKLLILQALQEKITNGQLQWSDIVPLKADWKSLPSGVLQTWPTGSALTIESLATLMISQSDNTATDHLLHSVGRKNLEARSPRNTPFLTTREAFVLKAPANRSILRRWRRRSEERRSFISALATLPLPAVSIFNAGPQAIDVEWFMTARELCSAMDTVANLPLMSINPGLIDANNGEKIAYKGGSEPGVENFTTQITDGDSRLCVSATWNNEAGIDELQFSTLYRSLVESAATAASTLSQDSPHNDA